MDSGFGVDPRIPGQTNNRGDQIGGQLAQAQLRETDPDHLGKLIGAGHLWEILRKYEKNEFFKEIINQPEVLHGWHGRTRSSTGQD